MTYLRRIADALLDALYPADCACFMCGKEAPLDKGGMCAHCSTDIKPGGAWKVDGLDEVCAAFKYEGAARECIRRFKYENAKHIAARLAQHISIPAYWGIDVVVPVPLHTKRLRERGYNQSALLAERIAAANGLLFAPKLLERIRNTTSQVGLGGQERAKNIAGAFRANEGCDGKCVLLVDDVLTTGATMRECANALRLRGAKKVYGAVAARD
ncbi:MAG: ComF family protein [Clostridia bacterium]|nr:ComF family protein [Clostridia bacterium]